MSLYVCDNCHAVENTALGNYWPATSGVTYQPRLCSECAYGEWHGRFEKWQATAKEIKERRDEFLHSRGLLDVLNQEETKT